MKCSFQSSEYLYIVMDLMEGGDLRYQMKNKTFNEDQTSKILVRQSSLWHAFYQAYNSYMRMLFYIET